MIPCLLLFLLPLGVRADVAEIDGDLDVHVHHSRGTEVMSYALRLDRDGTVRQLVFPAPLPGHIGSGTKLTVRVETGRTGGGVAEDVGSDTLHVADFSVRELGPGKDFPVGDATVDLHSITWVLDLCRNTNSATPASVRAKWFQQGTASTQTMQGFYDRCSFGKVSFTSANNVVVGPIAVPCNGTMSGGFAYSGATCGSVDIYAWAEYAENYTRNVLGLSVTPFTRRIMVLPDAQPCPWAGLGSVGCGAYCYTWVMSPYAVDLATTFHELGHNLGLQHSTTATDEYGDHSCAMGGATNVRCFNAPQMWRLGWATAAVTYDTTSSGFGPGVWHTHAVAADAVSDTAMIRVATPSSAFFVSYRQPLLYDSDLQPPYRDRVFVHTFMGSVGLLTRDKPQLQTLMGLGAGQTFSDAAGGWRVTVVAVVTNASEAIVSLCRFTSPVEVNCADGLDDDCNGAIDGADEACRRPPPPTATHPPAPPPPPPQPAPALCGDGTCDTGRGETRQSCPVDCCPHRCGDGTCDSYAEDCHTCPADCRVSRGGVCCGGAAMCGRGGCGACTRTCPMQDER